MDVKELSEIWNNNNKKGLRLRPKKSVKHKPKPGFKCKNNSAGNESNSWIVSLGLTVWVCRGAAAKRTPDLIGCIHVSLLAWWLKTVCGTSIYFKWLKLPQWVCRTSILLFSPFTDSNWGFTHSVFSILLHRRPVCTRFMSLELFLYYLYWSVILIHSPPRPPQHESWIWSHFAKLVPLKRARFIFLLVMQMYRKTQWFQEHWRKLNIYVPYKTWVKWLNIQRNQRP